MASVSGSGGRWPGGIVCEKEQRRGEKCYSALPWWLSRAMDGIDTARCRAGSARDGMESARR